MASFFQSLTAFFAPRRQGPRPANSHQALSYTHDAFSLPMHSPSSSHVDPGAFKYPPATPNTAPYDESPPSSSDRLNRGSQTANSLLPMHAPRSTSLPHPSLDVTWTRIREWLGHEYPELGDTLNWGILPEALGEIELNLGQQLPRAVRESYLVVDGQEAESSAGCSEGLFFGLTFLPLEDVLEEWRFWREVDDDPATGANHQLLDAMQSIPAGWIRRQYSSRGWIPLVTDKAGNYIGIDLNPPDPAPTPGETSGLGGSPGQVIVFGRDFDTKIVLWRGDGESGWAKWLASFAEELESGEGFEVRGSDASSPPSDDESEDSVGFEGYFFSGNGGGKGGDAGSSGGLRFTGEYKGWSAIEVWADKSYKRWHSAGLIPDEEEQQPTAGPSGTQSTSTSEPVPILITTVTEPLVDSTIEPSSATPTTLVFPSETSTSIAASNTISTLSSTESQSTPLLGNAKSSSAVASSSVPASKGGDVNLLSTYSPGPSSSWSMEDTPTSLAPPLVPLAAGSPTTIPTVEGKAPQDGTSFRLVDTQAAISGISDGPQAKLGDEEAQHVKRTNSLTQNGVRPNTRGDMDNSEDRRKGLVPT